MADTKRNARIRISPPQNVYFSKIQFSVGDDPLVKVVPITQLPDESYLITLRVKGTQKARALATLLMPEKRFGGIIVRVQVRNRFGTLIKPIRRTLTPVEIARLYRVAFRTNRQFTFVAVRRGPFLRGVFPVFKANVIQFFASNLRDLFGNLNDVAAFVFRDVLRTTISRTPINFSTEQIH